MDGRPGFGQHAPDDRSSVGSAYATIVRAGNLAITISGAASPRALRKKRMVPISFKGSASIATADGSHVPSVVSSHLQIDKHIVIETTGLQGCAPKTLESTDPSQAM